MEKLNTSLPFKLLMVICFFFASIITSLGVCCSLAAYELDYYSGGDHIVSRHPVISGFVMDFRYGAIICAVLGALSMLVIFIFLMCSAGHVKNSSEIVLNFFTRIPLDIFTALIVFFELLLAAILVELLSEYRETSASLFWLLGTLIISVGLLLLLWFFTNCAARIKYGKWWKNSVIYYLLHLTKSFFTALFKFFLSVIHMIPQSWRSLLVFIAYIVFSIVLSDLFITEQSFAAFLLLIIINLAVCCGIIFCSSQIKTLIKAGKDLADGKLNNKLDTNSLYFSFREHGKNLNAITAGISTAVAERMKSERLKTELITNVSHDIKTPLTSIVNYVDLLNADHTEEEEQAYLEVLSRQSLRLKKLIEDLIEASKASTGNIAVSLSDTNVEEILNQSIAEYSDILSAAELTAVFTPPIEPIHVLADGRLLWRVIDNLLSNAAKYSLAGTRVYINAACGSKACTIAIKNISRDSLNISADELTDRFVRGDDSRSTDGSGLGLNIAKSLTELMGGKLRISIDGDLFKAEVLLKLYEEQPLSPQIIGKENS